MKLPLSALLLVALALASRLSAAQASSHPPVIEGARTEVYKAVGDTQLSLYIFEPAGPAQKNRPAIVFFFGGGWANGSPTQFEPHCRALAARGMVAITADYRVFSRQKATAADCVADGKSALRYIRQNAGKLGIDPNRIAAGGGSAGGHVALATLLPGLDQAGEDTAVSCKPNALVLFNPVVMVAPLEGVDFKGFSVGFGPERLGAERTALSPIHHVERGAPPTIVFHGQADTTVPYPMVEAFARLMKAAGNRCELIGYEGQAHGFFNYAKPDKQYYEKTLAGADAFLVSLGYLPPPVKP